MKTLTITVTTLMLLVGTLSANDEALHVTKSHLRNFLHADHGKLQESYASKVILMPGHEFLKIEYGLATEPGRKKSIEVNSEKLIQAMKKASEARPARPAEKISAMLESLKFEVQKAEVGDFVATPSDPVGTPDAKLHFTIKEGDVLVKVSPPRGDYILLQLRQVKGAWKVVAEYLD